MHPPRDSPQSYPQNSFLGQGRGVVEYSTREGIRVGGGSWAVPKLSLSPHGAPSRRAPWDSNLPPLLCNRLSLVPLTSTSPTAESLGTWVCGGGEGNPISLPLHLARWTKGRGTIWSRQGGGGAALWRQREPAGLVVSLYFTDLHSRSPHQPNLRAGN